MSYRVFPFVRDRDLEGVLNTPGFVVSEIFRNSPGKDGEETSTVVLMQEPDDYVQFGTTYCGEIPPYGN